MFKRMMYDRDNVELAMAVLNGRKGTRVPIEVEIVPGYECNLNCRMCTQRTTHKWRPEFIKRVTSNLDITEEERKEAEKEIESLIKYGESNPTSRSNPYKLWKYTMDLPPNVRMLILDKLWNRWNYGSLSQEPQVPGNDFWTSLASSIRKAGIRKVTVTGGEPFLFWKRTRSIIDELMKDDSVVNGNIISNGTLIDRKKAKHLVDIGWNRIFISLDGAIPEHNDILRGKGSFEKAISGIKALNEAKALNGSDKPVLSLGFVITRYNYMDIVPMISKAKELGAREVIFSVLYVYNPAMKELALTTDEEKEAWSLLETARKDAEEKGILTNAGEFVGQHLWYDKILGPSLAALIKMEDTGSSPEELRDTFLELMDAGLTSVNIEGDKREWTCYEPELAAYVNPMGKLAPCCFFQSPDCLDIEDGDIIKTVNSPEWDKLVGKVNSDEPYIPCRNCGGWPRIRSQKVEDGMKDLKNPLYWVATKLKDVRR